MRTVPATVAIIAATLLAAACGSDTTSTSTATTTAAAPATTATTTQPTAGVTSPTPPASTPTASAPTDFATTPVSVAPDDVSGTALLSAVRAAAQEGFDRVTFEFSNHLPAYSVGVVKLVLQDGSGEEVAVDGAEKLQVRMTPASSADLSAGGLPTYTGPMRFSPGTPALVEVVQVGDFEGHLTWAIGVSALSGFKVSTLEGPPRLVVDIEGG